MKKYSNTVTILLLIVVGLIVVTVRCEKDSKVRKGNDSSDKIKKTRQLSSETELEKQFREVKVKSCQPLFQISAMIGLKKVYYRDISFMTLKPKWLKENVDYKKAVVEVIKDYYEYAIARDGTLDSIFSRRKVFDDGFEKKISKPCEKLASLDAKMVEMTKQELSEKTYQELLGLCELYKEKGQVEILYKDFKKELKTIYSDINVPMDHKWY